MGSNRWGVVLAGGDGTRLKALSRAISGDNRPKQFCVLFGSGSLLAKTRDRLAASIPPGRTLFVVVRDHERYYLPELADVAESRIVVQPANRGTSAAIACALLRITHLDADEDPVVAFFPADHHYSDEPRFARAVASAFAVVDDRPELLVLLGATPDSAQVEYGWIEPGHLLDPGPAFRVNRFWEKPSAPLAQTLLGRHCLWNTFVIVGRAGTFLDVLGATAPDMLNALMPLANARTHYEETELCTALYEAIAPGDFSRDVLTACPRRLAVLQMENTGWGDLGTPEGVLAAIHRSAPDELGSPPAPPDAFTVWLSGYCRQLDKLRLESEIQWETSTGEPRRRNEA
jgi:mannose-1-phosphate guanylyltransferase